VREFIRRLEAAGLTVEPTPGHYRVLRDGKPLPKANGMAFTLPFSPDTIRLSNGAPISRTESNSATKALPRPRSKEPPSTRSPWGQPGIGAHIERNPR
jgi:hypothetical protein